MKRVTIYDYKTGDIIGNASIDYDRYDALHPAPADPGAVRSSDWLTDDQLRSNGIDPDLTVWFEEI